MCYNPLHRVASSMQLCHRFLHHHCTPPLSQGVCYDSFGSRSLHTPPSSFSFLTSFFYWHASKTLGFLSSNSFHKHFFDCFSFHLSFSSSSAPSFSTFPLIVLSFLRLHHIPGSTSSTTRVVVYPAMVSFSIEIIIFSYKNILILKGTN